MSNLFTEICDADRATNAAYWCERNKINYDLEFWGWPCATKYRFIFDNDKDLVLFSLKWT